MKVLKTADGSVTLFSTEFGEPYHSITAGALKESLEKFCKPCRVEEKAKEGNVRLLDVCFGLGYNTAAFLHSVFSSNPSAKVSIIGFEKDLSVIKTSLKLNWKELESWKFILKASIKDRRIEKGFLTLNFFSPKISLKIYIGEGRSVVKNIWKKYQNFFDAVFHDPFSPKVNPEMWSTELFSLIRKMVKREAILATYSTSTAIRKALHMAGFGVKEGVALGRKSKSTVASPAFKTEDKILRKFSSAAAVPFRDPKLKDDRFLIKGRREGCMKLLLKELPLEVLF